MEHGVTTTDTWGYHRFYATNNTFKACVKDLLRKDLKTLLWEESEKINIFELKFRCTLIYEH